MIPDNLTLLRETREHWLDIKAGTSLAGASNCPLCRVYSSGYEPACAGCPIYEFTHSAVCYNTPYVDLCRHGFYAHPNTGTPGNKCPECERIIDEELALLDKIIELQERASQEVNL
jgi:hypothetical protein